MDLRPRLAKKSRSCVDVSRSSSTDRSFTSFDNTVHSLPETYDSDEVVQLKLKMEQLTLELDGSHLEIEKLSSENRKLVRELSQCRKTIENYKKLAIQDGPTPKKGTTKKKGGKPKRTENLFLEEKSTTNSTPKRDINSNTPENTEVLHDNKKVRNNETQTTPKRDLNLASSLEYTEVRLNNKQVKNIETQTTPKRDFPNVGNTEIRLNNKQGENMQAITDADQFVNKADENRKVTEGKAKKSNERKKKICLISTDNKNNITEKAINIWENMEIIHYCYPQAKNINLFENLDTKLKDYTKKDYCLVFLGNNDFYVTNNYCDIVKTIRDKLSIIQHTNIILCCPSFRLGVNLNLFNHRVEIFNNLLYLDIMSHEYAFFVDSNKKLTYTFEMFNYNSYINEKGILTILNVLYSYINDLDQFFRNSKA